MYRNQPDDAWAAFIEKISKSFDRSWHEPNLANFNFGVNLNLKTPDGRRLRDLTSPDWLFLFALCDKKAEAASRNAAQARAVAKRLRSRPRRSADEKTLKRERDLRRQQRRSMQEARERLMSEVGRVKKIRGQQ